MAEINYQFRERMAVVHQPDRRDTTRLPTAAEITVTGDYLIAIPREADVVVKNAARDLEDYFFTSMGLSLRVVYEDEAAGAPRIAYGVDAALPENSYRFAVREGNVSLVGCSPRMAAQAGYYLEDLMNLREAPFLEVTDTVRTSLYNPRMVHSGYGLDMYPTEHLLAIAHAGISAILVFIKDVDITPHGYHDFNDLCHRAAAYGLDVYAYSYMKSGMNPEEEGAEAYYDELYGTLFRECPGLKGVTLVGESVGFPTKDPRAAAPGETAIDGIPTGKVHSGFYPCEDYPVWINLLKKVIRKYKADADIVFWTYNFTWRSEEERVRLIKSLPTDISLLVTFERFELLKVGASKLVSQDYTLSFVGPSHIFASEAKAAHERGIRLYAMTNTGGKTWDFGTAPYEPMPYQWMRRFDAMYAAKANWGLSGIMETHHYGMYPSMISKLAKHAFLYPTEPYEEVLKKILASRYGKENIAAVDEALRDFSEAINHLTPTKADEHGALRVGPAHPLNLFAQIKIPADKDAHFGNRIWYPHVYTTGGWQSLHSLRVRDEMASMQMMVEHMEKGLARLYAIPNPNDALLRLTGLGQFISNTVKTCVAAKKMYILDARLRASGDPEEILAIADEIEEVVKADRKVAEDTIPIVERDSSLGYEPSMHYMTDKWHLEWKLRHSDFVLNTELRELREAVAVHLK